MIATCPYPRKPHPRRLRVATLAVLILAVLAAVLGLAALGGWAGTLGIAVVVAACIAAMIRYGDG